MKVLKVSSWNAFDTSRPYDKRNVIRVLWFWINKVFIEIITHIHTYNVFPSPALRLHCLPITLMRPEIRMDDPTAAQDQPLTPETEHKVLTPRHINSTPATQTLLSVLLHRYRYMKPHVYRKHHIPHMGTKHMKRVRIRPMQEILQNMSLSNVQAEPARTSAFWREKLWRSKLGSRCKYQNSS